MLGKKERKSGGQIDIGLHPPRHLLKYMLRLLEFLLSVFFWVTTIGFFGDSWSWKRILIDILCSVLKRFIFISSPVSRVHYTISPFFFIYLLYLYDDTMVPFYVLIILSYLRFCFTFDIYFEYTFSSFSFDSIDICAVVVFVCLYILERVIEDNWTDQELCLCTMQRWLS